MNRSKLAAFFDHADESNDIFRVAAQVIASTIVTADRLLQQQAADAADDAEAQAAYANALSAASAGQRTAARVITPEDAAEAEGAAGPERSPAGGAASEQEVATAAYARAASTAHSNSSQQQVVVAADVQQQAAAAASSTQQQQQYLAALQAAFLPFALGHKGPWWDVVVEQEKQQGGSAEGGSGDEEEEEEELRAQLRELSADSLALLTAGLKDGRFPQLFDLQVREQLGGRQAGRQ